MNIEELIENYNKEVSEEIAAKKKAMDDLIADRRKIFENTAFQNLGDLWNQLAPEGTEYHFQNRDEDILFSIPVSWGGMKGYIKQRLNLKRSQWSTMELDFGTRHDKNGAYYSLHEDLIDPEATHRLGRLFSDLNRFKEYAEWQEAEHRIEDLHRALDFGGYNESQVDDLFNRRVDAFPDHASEIFDAATARRRELAVIAEQKLQEQLAYELKQSERAQLELLVDFAWRGPFKINKVTYGAKMGSDEDGASAVYTNYFYTLMEEFDASMPHNRGYWTAFEKGMYTRKIKPMNVISIEEVTIEGAGKAPAELRRYIDLKSKVLSDVSIFSSIPPIELFAFDYDQLRIAVEAEQDLEIANASQEDLS